MLSPFEPLIVLRVASGLVHLPVYLPTDDAIIQFHFQTQSHILTPFWTAPVDPASKVWSRTRRGVVRVRDTTDPSGCSEVEVKLRMSCGI